MFLRPLVEVLVGGFGFLQLLFELLPPVELRPCRAFFVLRHVWELRCRQEVRPPRAGVPRDVSEVAEAPF